MSVSVNVKWQQAPIQCGSMRGIIVKPAGGSKAPFVVALHGRKEDMHKALTRYRPLTEYGIGYLVFDLHGFGGRASEPGLTYDWCTTTYTTVEEYGPMLLELQLQTAGEVSRWIDTLVEDQAVDRQRIGVTGVSLGAFSAMHAVARDRRIKAAALLLGGADWALVMHNRAMVRGGVGPQEAAGQLSDSFRRRQAENAPENYRRQLRDRPLLFVAGQKDTKVPPATFEKRIASLRAAYGRKELLEYVVWPDLGHSATEPVVRYCVEWFGKSL